MAQVLAFTLQINGLESINDLKKAVKDTTAALNDKAINSVEYKELQKRLIELKAAQSALNLETRAAAGAVTFAAGSYRELNATLGQIRGRYKDLSEADRNSDLGRSLRAQIQSLDKELKGLDANIGQYQRNVGNYASAFNNLGGVFASLGIGLGVSEIADATADYTLKVSELQSITGVTGQGLEQLKNAISELTVVTTDGGKKIVSSGADIAESLKLAGSARPELLSNIEALKQFTKEAIIFAKSGSLPIQDSINSLSSTLAQFEEPATEAGRVMNVLAAGAKAGASEIKDTSAAIEVFGAGAKSANVSVEESVALVETLGDKFIKNSEAGTKLRNILLTIKAPQGLDAKAQAQLVKYGVSFEKLSDTTLPLGDRLRELSKIQGDANALLQVFGKENVTAGEILLNNVDRFNELTLAVTGTNEAYIQAAINTDNLAQVISNAKNAAINLSVATGEFLYNSINALIGALSQLATFIDNNKVALLAAGFAVAAYSASINGARLSLLSFQIAEKLEPIYTYAVATAKNALTIAMNAVPYVAAGIAIFGLVKAMQSWFGATEAQIKTQEILLTSQTELSEAYSKEAQSAAELFAIAQSDVSSKEQKAAAVKRIIDLYPNYLGGFTTEAQILANLDVVQKAVNKGILDGAVARIKANKIQEATTELIDLQLKKQQVIFELEKKGADINGSFAQKLIGSLDTQISEVKNRLEQLPKQLQQVANTLENQSIDFTGVTVSDKEIKEVQKQLAELAAFRLNLNKTTGKDLDENGKQRYDFLVSEEKRLQLERNKLVSQTIGNDAVTAQKSIDLTTVTEAKKTEIVKAAAKENKADTLDELTAKLKELQSRLSGLSSTPSKIPSSLLDDISKTKKEIDELQAKLAALAVTPLDARGAQRQEAVTTQTIDITVNTTNATSQLREYLNEADRLQSEARDKTNTDDLAAQKQLLDLKAQNDAAAAQQEAQQRKNIQQELAQGALQLAREVSSSILAIEKEAIEREKEAALSAAETQRDRELTLAGNNATVINRINQDFADKKLALDREAFEENKKLQIANALINGALAATAVFAVPDFTFGVLSAIRLGFIAANTALQVATISSQNFAEGGFVKGAGTGTSDSIKANLSNGEFVLKAATVSRVGVDNLNRLNETASFNNIAPSPQSNTVNLSEQSINQIIQGVERGTYAGSSQGIKDGVKVANRENSITKKLI